MNSRSLILLVCAAFVLNVGAFRGHVSLSPKTWFPRDLQRLEALQSSPRRPKPLAFSDGKGLVAGTSSALAVHAGTEALSKGGNAMDACLTTALTEVVLSTGSHLSYAGTANILYYESTSGETFNLDAGWKKPYYIDSAQIPDNQAKDNNGASILVPGFVAGVSMAADTFSLFPLKILFEPALYFAQKGFKVPGDLAEAIKKHYNPKTLLRTPEGKQLFTNPKTQKPYRAGERFRQPKLAKFIKRLSKHGKDYFYRGHWAEEMVEMAQNHDGYITMEDMNEYHAKTLEPATTHYQQYQVLTAGTEWGGAELIEMLNLMELAGIGGSTDTYLTNATKLFWLASITRLSSFISLFTHAVPNGRQILKEHLDLDIDNSDRLTKSAAEDLWDRIASPTRMKELNDIMREMLASNAGHLNMKQHQHGSSGVVAVDSEGNVCSLVHGTDSALWGSGLFVEGVSLPSSGIALKSLMKGTKAGERVPSGLQPVIVFKEDAGESTTSRDRRQKRHIAARRRGKEQQLLRNMNDGRHEHKKTQNHLEESFRPHSLSNESQRTKKDNGIEKPVVHLHDLIILRKSSSSERKEKQTVTPIHPTETQGPGKLSTLPSKKSSAQSKEAPTQPLEQSDSKGSRPLIVLRESSAKDRNSGSMALPADDYQEEAEGLDEKLVHEKVMKIPQDESGWQWDMQEVDNIDLEDIREFPHLGVIESWDPDLEVPDDTPVPDETDEYDFPIGQIPVLALACTGRSHPFVVPQYLTNILNSGMNPKAALEAPTFLAPSPNSYQQDIQVEKYAIDENILLSVNELGQTLTEVDFQTAEDESGTGVAVTFDGNRKMLGCAHPYKGGFAEGVSVLKLEK